MDTNHKLNGTDNSAFVAELGDLDKTKNEKKSSNKVDEIGEEETENRAQWGHGLEFLMSCIAMSVGLGNIWRFPFTAKENGGAAFLIPYLIVLTVIGRPLYYMEMALGQFSGRGNVKMYEKMSPVLKSIGFGQLIGSICVATYYCSLMAITLVYLGNSFTNDLPWMECQPGWSGHELLVDKTCISASSNETPSGNVISSSELFFRIEVLKQKLNIDDGIGLPDLRLSLCLLGSWIVTLLVSIRGVKSSGKASYFLALFPYAIMITLLIKAATLEGAGEGIRHFFSADWNKLLEADVWYAAVSQCFFSLNVGFGSIIMFSSFNSFDYKINRDAFVITTLDTFTSLLSGSTIFGILGNLAHELGTDVSNVISGGGTALAFISYPDAISKFNSIPWMFAILFFFMLFVLGIGSLAALQASVNTVIHDAFPELKPWIISCTTGTVMFFIGLMYVTPGGQYMLELVDHFGGTFIIYVFVILEVGAVTLLYGLQNFCLDVEFMTKNKVNGYFRICWGLIMPVLLVSIFIYFLYSMQTPTYGENVAPYPPGILAFGWSILGIGVLQTVFWIFYYIYANREYPAKKIIPKAFSTKTWSPVGSKRIYEWRQFKNDILVQNGPKQGNIVVQKIRFLFLGY